MVILDLFAGDIDMTEQIRKNGFHSFLCKSDSSRLHTHIYIEFGYVYSGEALSTIGDSGELLLHTGDYYLIEPGTYHKYTAAKYGELSVYNIGFSHELFATPKSKDGGLDELLKLIFSNEDRAYVLPHIGDRIFHDKNGHVRELIDKLEREYREKHFGYKESARSLISLMLAETIRASEVKFQHDRSVGIVSYITNIIEKSSEKQLKLGDIADELGYDSSYLCRSFKKELGISFGEYLQRTRINKSCRLLRATDKNVNTIAELVGYSDIKFFDKLFKRYMNMTPSEYRAAAKKL